MAVENDREREGVREMASRGGGWPTLLAEKVHGGAQPVSYFEVNRTGMCCVDSYLEQQRRPQMTARIKYDLRLSRGLWRCLSVAEPKNKVKIAPSPPWLGTGINANNAHQVPWSSTMTSEGVV